MPDSRSASSNGEAAAVRVLYSFPHRLGAGRITDTAWHEINSATEAGVRVTAVVGDVVTPLPPGIEVHRTFRRGPVRLPYGALGVRRMCALHDKLVARSLPKYEGRIDIVNAWPLGALETIEAAHRLGMRVVLARPNTHTEHAYRVVAQESRRIGLELPKGAEHAHDARVLSREIAEYSAADALLSPSEVVSRSFTEVGFPTDRLIPVIYGIDPAVYHPAAEPRAPRPGGLRALFVGYSAVRKGLHLALDAWLSSKASTNGEFLVAGDFLPAYRDHLEEKLTHPTVRVLGRRNDIAELMRTSDVLVFPTVEEGFGLVCTEAMASGCVPVVSDAVTDLCRHGVNSLVHNVGDVAQITRHLDMLAANPALLGRLRAAGIRDTPEFTWSRAGQILRSAYERSLEMPLRNP